MESKVTLLTDDEMIGVIKENKLAKRQTETQLFNQYSYLIKEGMSKYSLEEEDAFTAYSDTILQSLDNIADSIFEKRSSLKTYLYKIFNNKCVDLIRKKTTNKRSIYQTAPISEMMDMISDQAKNVIQQLIEKNDFDLLRRRLNELGENCRKLLLFFADGYTDKEIAAFLEYKTADVVKTSRLRCMEKLRGLYIKNKG
ncbi:MAG: sigma-70 family RNA polymerase sigma factor [Ginsengibacter sp.]